MEVSRTKFISPSKAYLFTECKLRYIAESERVDGLRTPSNPSALVGAAVHATIEEFLKRETTHGFSEIVIALQDKLVKLADRNSKENKVLAYVKEVFGIDKVFSYSQIGVSSRYVDKVLKEFKRRDSIKENITSSGDSYRYIGCERNLSSDSLQISGSADFIYQDVDSCLVIADFKTGKIRADSELNASYVFQVACYGAILKELTGRTDIKIRLIGSDDDWTSVLTQELLNKVYYFSQSVRKDLPLNTIFDSSTLCSLSAACSNCSFRPSCGAYTKLINSNDFESIDNLPSHDISGSIVSVISENGLSSLRLIDPVGRLRQVSGVPEGMIDSTYQEGCGIKFYNLKSRETAARSKLVANFYIVDAEQPQSSAFQAVMKLG